MTNDRRFILRPVPMGGTAAASAFASIMVERLRNTRNGRRQAELENAGMKPETRRPLMSWRLDRGP